MTEQVLRKVEHEIAVCAGAPDVYRLIADVENCPRIFPPTVYADAGQRVARYDKIHLFDVDIPGRNEPYRESAHIAPGSRLGLVPTPAGLLGLSVCYDMRFPEMYRSMAAAGAQWFTVPAAFTVPTGRAHWEALLR